MAKNIHSQSRINITPFRLTTENSREISPSMVNIFTMHGNLLFYVFFLSLVFCGGNFGPKSALLRAYI